MTTQRTLAVILAEAQDMNSEIVRLAREGNIEAASDLEYTLEDLRKEWLAAGGE